MREEIQTTIADQATCPDCRIELEPLATLQGEPPGAPAWLCNLPSGRAVDIDGAGRVLAIACHRNAVLVFTGTGEYLETIGRHGEAPGEFQSVRAIGVDDRDVLHVFESRRHTAIAPDREILFARSTRGYPRSFFFRPGGGTVQAGIIRTPDAVAFPLHEIDTAGQVVRSFGSLEPIDPSASSALRHVATAGDGGVWSLHLGKYELELWNRDGVLERVLVREGGWFAELKRERQGALRGLHRDRTGLLWTLALMPDPGWQGPALTGLPESGPPRSRFPNEQDLRSDTWIEVVEPERGEVLVTERLDRVHWMVGDLVYSTREMGDGGTAVDVWRLRLVRPSLR